MSHSFFENQERAKRNTTLLVGLYALCVALITMGAYICVLVVEIISVSPRGEGESFNFLEHPIPVELWQPQLFVATTLSVLLIIGLGSLYRISQLSSGGSAVAGMLGGLLVPSGSRDPHHRKILNIVEEMAIASGIPVPPVYLMAEEQSINAFAAGFSTKDAVIGVTDGCIKRLSRDELQGVIAHEFSHILNGDMRLNIRLIGVLNGILVLSLVGYTLFRVFGNSAGRQSSYSSSRRSKGNPAMAIVIFGLLLYVLGYIGVFFARLIQSAVSRQREFLADASAVQFTRNPLGIGAALAKIAGLAFGSEVTNYRAQEASHIFFADGLRRSFFSLFASHPPIKERLRRIDPAFVAKFKSYCEGRQDVSEVDPSAEAFAPKQGKASVVSSFSSLDNSQSLILDSIGQATPENQSSAKELVAQIPEALLTLARETAGARAVVLAMLTSGEPSTQESQLAWLSSNCDSLLLRDLLRILPDVERLPVQCRIPLVEVSLSALQQHTKPVYQTFRKATQFFIEADGRCTVFEYALQRMFLRNLDFKFGVNARFVFAHEMSMSKRIAVEEVVLAMACLTNKEPAIVRESIKAGLLSLGYKDGTISEERSVPSIQSLDMALGILEDSEPALREKVIKACIATVYADNKINIAEFELLRAVAYGLGCPIPPMVMKIS